jgi:hypothetical protein
VDVGPADDGDDVKPIAMVVRLLMKHPSIGAVSAPGRSAVCRTPGRDHVRVTVRVRIVREDDFVSTQRLRSIKRPIGADE